MLRDLTMDRSAMPHDPETFALIVSAGHWIVGAFLFPISILVWMEARRGRGMPAPWAIPAVIATTGVALMLYVVFHDPARWREMVGWTLRDVRQIQHLAFAALLVTVAGFEYRANRTGGRTAALAWPVGYLVLGFAFIVHMQVGDHARDTWIYHVGLGLLVMFAGAARISQVTGRLPWQTGGLVLAALLMVVGVMLVTYRERPHQPMTRADPAGAIAAPVAAASRQEMPAYGRGA